MRKDRMILKYKVPMEGNFTLQIPKAAQILTLQVQDDEPCLWVLANPDAPKVEWRFRLLKTGVPIEESEGELAYIGTIQLRSDVPIIEDLLGPTMVAHLFLRPHDRMALVD